MTEQPPLEPPLRPVTGPGSGAQPAAGSSGAPLPSPGSRSGLGERPEVAIAGTFVGGLVLATILKRLAR